MKIKPLSLGFFILTFISFAVYAYFIEPFNIQIHRVNIHDSVLYRAWEDIRIAQLSDLHITKIGRREELVLKKLEHLKPDLIVVTGDSAQWNSRPENALIFLEKLSAPLGVYCVMGDADFSSARYHCIFCHPGGNVHKQRKTPIFLRNRTIEISLGKNFNHRHLTITGMAAGNSWSPDQDYTEEIGKNNNRPKALLILGHFSEKWARLTTLTQQPLLWLAGDTHGGQIWLPDFIWKIIKFKPDALHMAGLYQNSRHQYLYVNRGIGTTENFPFRLGVRPEIAIISFSEEARK